MSHKRKSVKKASVTMCGMFAATMLMGSVCCPANETDISLLSTEATAVPTNLVLTSEEVVNTPYDYDVVYVSPPLMSESSVEENVPAIPYTEEDLDLLARLLTAEMGMSWVDDKIQLYVGSVVLNRMNHDLYPDTLYDVIYDKGQYSPTWTGTINNTPDERTIANARLLLEEGSILPENVIFQANFPQGDGTYFEYYDEILGTTTYFCYISN